MDLETICVIEFRMHGICDGHEKILDDGSNLGIAEKIINMIMVVQHLVERVHINEVLGFNHDAFHYEVHSFLLLRLKTLRRMPGVGTEMLCSWEGGVVIGLVDDGSMSSLSVNSTSGSGSRAHC
jgi:hypothetical protein